MRENFDFKMKTKTIEMKDLRHLNLFGKITKVPTRFFFEYNNAYVFCVPKGKISKAAGDKGKNVKKLHEILNRRIKIIPLPKDENDAEDFFRNIVSPTEFKELEVKDNEIIINAGQRNKAALIGRNKRRLIELQKISKDYFGKNLKIS